MSTKISGGRSGWQSQPVKTVQPGNWDEQLDSLLSDLDNAKPTPSKSSALVPMATNQGTSQYGSGPGLDGREDFHERQEFTSPDQRTKTIEERSQRTARSRDGQQLIRQHMYKSASTSAHPAGSVQGSNPAIGDIPHIDIDGEGVPDLSTLLPEANTPLAPGQKRIIQYDVRRTHQRSVSPAPAPAPTPPPVKAKPPPQQSPPPDTYRSYSSVSERTTAAPPPATLAPSIAAGTSPPGSSTTINYHIYNYGATGPDGAPLEGAPPPSQASTIERHETHEHRRLDRDGTPVYPARGRGPPGGQPVLPVPSSTVNRYETREYTTHSDRPTPAYGGAGPYSPPPGIPDSHTSTVERYETRSQSHTSAGRPPSPYDNRAAPVVVTHTPEEPRPALAGSHTTRYVTREVERTHTAGPGYGAGDERGPQAVVPTHPQDATYPDGPRRREVTSQQTAMIPVDNSDVTDMTSPSKTQTGVYYPPGDINADHKWKTVEKSKDGNTRTKFEAEGRYKAKGGSKQKEDKGGKTIPICLPCCGGAACVVM